MKSEGSDSPQAQGLGLGIIQSTLTMQV